MPERIQLSRAKGYRMPEGAIKVDRSTRWGNPFEVGRRVIAPGAYGSIASPYHGCLPSGMHGSGLRAYEIRRVRDRAEAVLLFASYVHRDPSGWPPEEIRYGLRDADLACWCPEPEPGAFDWCHGGAVLLPIAAGCSPAEVEREVLTAMRAIEMGDCGHA